VVCYNPGTISGAVSFLSLLWLKYTDHGLNRYAWLNIGMHRCAWLNVDWTSPSRGVPKRHARVLLNCCISAFTQSTVATSEPWSDSYLPMTDAGCLSLPGAGVKAFIFVFFKEKRCLPQFAFPLNQRYLGWYWNMLRFGSQRERGKKSFSEDKNRLMCCFIT